MKEHDRIKELREEALDHDEEGWICTHHTDVLRLLDVVEAADHLLSDAWMGSAGWSHLREAVRAARENDSR